MVPGTYTQLYIHLIFAVKNRQNLLQKSFRQKVFKYIGGILSKIGHIPIIINGVADHIHILFIMNPKISLSETVREVKRSSSIFINNHLKKGKFKWQRGYGAFSYSQSNLDKIVSYIKNQEEHHKKRTFREEYIDFLKNFKIKFNEEFLFEFWD